METGLCLVLNIGGEMLWGRRLNFLSRQSSALFGHFFLTYVRLPTFHSKCKHDSQALNNVVPFYRQVCHFVSFTLNDIQDGRLAPAYFSPDYECFDQLLQTVKNRTTVSILVFKELLQTSIWPLISVLYAKRYHDFPLKNFCLRLPKNFVEEPFCVSENLWYRKNVRDKRGSGYHDFPSKLFCLTVPKNFVGEPFGDSENFWYRKILCFRGLCHDFSSKSFCLTVPKHFVKEPFCGVFQKISGSQKVYG